jgi:hypothetical protein
MPDRPPVRRDCKPQISTARTTYGRCGCSEGRSGQSQLLLFGWPLHVLAIQKQTKGDPDDDEDAGDDECKYDLVRVNVVTEYPYKDGPAGKEGRQSADQDDPSAALLPHAGR